MLLHLTGEVLVYADRRVILNIGLKLVAADIFLLSHFEPQSTSRIPNSWQSLTQAISYVVSTRIVQVHFGTTVVPRSLPFSSPIPN